MMMIQDIYITFLTDSHNEWKSYTQEGKNPRFLLLLFYEKLSDLWAFSY